MKSTVYVETSIVSYLTARPARDLVLAAHQQVTRDWWEAREAFGLYVSRLVLEEASFGDGQAARRRLDALAELPLLDIPPEAEALGLALVRRLALPANAALDALHISVATVHGIEYVLTWNCKHMANAMMRGKIEAVCRDAGYEPPIICTPLELLQE